jgi:hypothetical protein
MLPVVVTYANSGYRDFVENLLRSFLYITKNHRIVCYCLDDGIYNHLVQYYSHPRIEIRKSSKLTQGDVAGYGSEQFNRLTHTKMQILLNQLKESPLVHFVDGDVIFRKEPTEEYYAKYADYDIVYQRDAAPAPFHEWTCTGNMVLRNTPATIRFLELIAWKQSYLNKNDQECQREIFRDANVTDIRTYPLAKLNEFPMEEFTSGFVVREFIQKDETDTHHAIFRDYPKMKLEALHESCIVFHANHVSSKQDKIDLFKTMGSWYF